jgi:hypothetical protein
MNLLRRFDVVHGANNTLTWDDGEPGGYTRVRTEDGLWMVKSIAATPEEQRQREADALRRELTGVEFRLAHLDDEPPWWQLELPSPETIERERTSLTNTRQTILSELELRKERNTNVNVSGKRELQERRARAEAIAARKQLEVDSGFGDGRVDVDAVVRSEIQTELEDIGRHKNSLALELEPLIAARTRANVLEQELAGLEDRERSLVQQLKAA